VAREIAKVAARRIAVVLRLERYRSALRRSITARRQIRCVGHAPRDRTKSQKVGTLFRRKLGAQRDDQINAKPFVRDSVEPGSVIHTDGWLGYLPLEKKGYEHEITFVIPTS
jgi:hypothetical protein